MLRCPIKGHKGDMGGLIEFVNVEKRFGTHHLFEDFNLTIANREVVSIIGPSGSGKSTILRILMTLEGIEGGEVLLEGEGIFAKNSPAHFREIRKSFGMVFQHFNLFPHLSVLENITIAPIHTLKLSRKQAEERALELLELVGLLEKRSAHPASLSGGQKQRVAIARALAMRPRVLLLDEITSALDPELVGEVLDVIRDISRKHQLTMVIVTHEMAFAAEISDRVCFMDAGRIVEEGAPEIILKNPQKQRTREFLARYRQTF